MPVCRCPWLAVLLLATLASAACGGGSGGDAPETPPPRRDRIAFGARTADGQYGLYVVAPDGSGLERLSDEQGIILFPRWSPFGDRIAYIVGTEDEPTAGTLRLFDFESRSATTVSDQAAPSLDGPAISWSPSGERLVFVEATGGGELRLFDVGEGELIDFPKIAGAAPAWSPDGDEIAFVSPGGELSLVDADGENERVLLDRAGLQGNPRWSPDGQRLAVGVAPTDEPDARSLVLVSRDGSDVTELGPGLDAAWSQAGRLAYTAPKRSDANDLDLFLAALPGAEPEPLAESVTRDRWPAWSPDGDRVVYLAEVDAQTTLLCLARLDPPERDCLDLPGLLPGAPDWR